MSINLRIQQLVEIKAGGNKARFAKLIGWVPQYISRVTKADGPTGLAVVEQILTKFKDVNPRWLIFGEGDPLMPRIELVNDMNEIICILNEKIQSINSLSDIEAEQLSITLNRVGELLKIKQQPK